MSAVERQARPGPGPAPGPGPGRGFGMQIGGGGAKAKDFNKTIRNLGSYLKPYKVSMIIVICFAFLSTVFSIVGPKLLGKVTTKLAEGLFAYYARTGLLTDFNYMGKIIILLIVLYTISAICSYVQGYMMAKVSMDVTYKLRKNISEKMNRIPLNYYDTRTHGEVLSRITNDVDLVSQTLNQSLTQIITSVTSIVGVLAMMLSISWLMTLVALLVVPLSMSIVGIVIKRSQGYFKDQQKYLGEINGHVEEMYGGHNIVQAFNGEQESIEIF